MTKIITPEIKTKILQLAPTMSQADVAKQLNLQASTVCLYIRQEKERIEAMQNQLKANIKAEHLELDTDIAFELSNLCSESFDREKAECDLFYEFSQAFGIELKLYDGSLKDESLDNKSAFLDFLKTKIYELY